jgi:hypothetical protein
MIANVVSHHRDAFLGIEIDDPDAEGAQPLDAALEIPGVANDQRAKSELAHESAAVPTGSERGDHDHVAVTSLTPGVAERIRFAVQGRIAVLYAAVVASSYETSTGVKNRSADRKTALGEAFPRFGQRDRKHSCIGWFRLHRSLLGLGRR